MTGRSTTRKEISDKLSQDLSIDQKKANDIVNATFDIIIEGLVKGDDIKLHSFATFSVRQTKNRVMKDLHSGEEVMLPAQKVASFKACYELKQIVAKGVLSQDMSPKGSVIKTGVPVMN